MTDREMLESRTADPTLNRRGLGLLGFAILSSLLFLGPAVDHTPLALDEHVSYWVVNGSQGSSIWNRSLNYSAVPPLSSWMQWLSFSAFGHTAEALRLASVAFAIAALPVMYFAIRSVSGAIPAGIAAVVLAWHPDVVDEVRIGRCYGLVLFEATVLVWIMLAWTRSSHSRLLGVAWTCVATALIWTHLTTAPVVAASAVILIWQALRSKNRSQDLVVAVIAIVCVGVASLPLVPMVERLSRWSALIDYSQESVPWSTLIPPVWWAGLPAGLVTFELIRLFVRRSVPTMGKRANLSVAIAMGLSALPLLAIAGLAFGDMESLANPRYRIATAPGFAAVVALLLASRSWTASFFSAAVLLIVSWGITGDMPWQPHRLGDLADRDWKQAAYYLNKEADAEAPIFVQSGLVESNVIGAYVDDRTFHEYVACRLGNFYLPQPHQRFSLPSYWGADRQLRSHYGKLVSSFPVSQPIWIAAATDTDLNRHSLFGFEELLRSYGYTQTFRQDYDEMVLSRYERQSNQSDTD